MPMPMPQQPQAQGPQTAEQMGAVPQAAAMPQKPGQGGQVSPQDLEYFRNGDQELKQAIEMFVGHPVDMKSVPDNILIQVAGMVSKLGVQGAVAMAQKMIPPQVQQQLKAGGSQGGIR